MSHSSFASSAGPQYSIKESFHGKHVFITGATGFVGKCVVEKIMRDIPDFGHIYLLIRPRKGQTAEERMVNDIFSSPAFVNCRKMYPDFDQVVASKVTAVAGEMTQSNIGIHAEQLAFLKQNLDIVIHCAASVDFQERLDRALELNAFGALRLLEIVKACAKRVAFIHTSTCYVNSYRLDEFDIKEKIYPLPFDLDTFLEKVKNLNDLQLEDIETTGLLGHFPNTYTLTKNIAEQLLLRHRGDVPLTIVRPSIVGGAWQEPLPGWVDVISAASAVLLSVSMGIIKFLHAPGTLLGDLIPVDHVVTALLAAVPHTIHNPQTLSIFHCGSSHECPMSWDLFKLATLDFLVENTPARAISKPEFSFVSTGQMYQLQLFIRHSIPSAVMNYIALVGNDKLKQKADQLNKVVWRVRVIAQSFHHFINYEWCFHSSELRRCHDSLPEAERSLFNLELKNFDMLRYIQVFNYGLLKYILKEPVVEANMNQQAEQVIDFAQDFTRNVPSLPLYRRVFPDADWMIQTAMHRPDFPKSRSVSSMISLVLGSPEVREVIQQKMMKENKTLTDVEGEAKKICKKMFGNMRLPVISGLGLAFKKIWRRIYRALVADKSGILAAQQAAQHGPLVIIPTHRSYMDFLIVSFLCFAANLPMPFIAAGEDFLGILFVRWLFRNCGAFFMRRSFSSDVLYSTIFNRYVEQLLVDGQSLEFFIEGTRSRSGKMIPPKLGLLTSVTNVFLNKKVSNVSIVPMSINYERIMETNSYSTELMGEKKIRESLRSLLNNLSVLSLRFGRVSVKFGQIISLSEFVERHVEHRRDPVQNPPAFEHVPLYLPPRVMEQYKAGTAPRVNRTKADYNPMKDVSDAKDLVETLANKIIYELSKNTQCMPTHLVATLMLMFRQGITKDELVKQCEWLYKEIISRGGLVVGYELMNKYKVVDLALGQLGALLEQRTPTIVEPNISARSVYHNMLALGHYRNRIIHIFFRESLWACALYALGGQSHAGVEQARLLQEVEFLFEGLRKEFIDSTDPYADEPFTLYLDAMVEKGILHRSENNVISVPESGESRFSFLCSMLWPSIDSLYVSALILFSLQPSRSFEEMTLLKRTQWLATTMYHEKMICFYEACSKETLLNSLRQLQSWNVIAIEKKVVKKRKEWVVSLLPKYQSKDALSQLLSRIERLRKPPPVSRRISSNEDGAHRNIIAELPILAKL